MAEPPPPVELQPQAKTVQELAATNRNEVPERYICKGDNGGVLDDSFPVLDVPTIDFGLLASSTAGGEELEKLRSAQLLWLHPGRLFCTFL